MYLPRKVVITKSRSTGKYVFDVSKVRFYFI